MAKLNDKLYNRTIVGKLIIDSKDELGEVADEFVSKFSTSDITSLSDDILNELKVGDVVQKITGNMKHCYIVTYKEEKHGICLSYFACGYLETVSYDYTSSHWVYNSTDKLQDCDLVVKTLEQTEANETINFSAPTVTGFTKLNEYCRCIKVNQSFKIILCARYQNDDTTTTKNFSLGNSLEIEVPSVIGKKIYDLGNKTLNESALSGKCENVIRVAMAGFNVYGQNNYVQPCNLVHKSADKLGITHSQSVGVAGDNILAVTIEINLTLV